MPKTFDELPSVQFTGEDIMSGRFQHLQAKAAREVGPIFKWQIRDGYQPGDYVYMVGPEANRFVFHTGREHFSHDLGWTPIIGESFGHGLLNMDDPEHAVHRQMWNPAFARAAMESYLPTMRRVIAEQCRTWVERDEVDVYAEAREITFDIAASALAGFSPGPEVDRLRELFYVLIHGFEPTRETWDEYFARAMAARNELAGMLLALIAERRRQPASTARRDVVGAIVHARDDRGVALSDEQILAHVNILLVAGHETTTTLAAHTLRMLALLPEWRRRIEAELAALRGRGADEDGETSAKAPRSAGDLDSFVSDDWEASAEVLRAARDLDNFVKETGRLYPPVLNVPRGVLTEYEFGGYTVPAGTPVRLGIAAGHLLPDVFAEPERFDPDRFAPPREEDRRPYALVTFGGGQRICIGINFAQIEVKALVAHVLGRYDLEPVGQEVVHAGHWTAILRDGIHLRVRPREGVGQQAA